MSATASQIVDTEFGSYKSEVRDGMRIDWDVPIRTDDGVVLRADVYRPIADGRYPANSIRARNSAPGNPGRTSA